MFCVQNNFSDYFILKDHNKSPAFSWKTYNPDQDGDDTKSKL